MSEEWKQWMPHSPLATWQAEAGPRTQYSLGSSQCQGPDLARLLSWATDDQKEQWRNFLLSPYASMRGSESLRDRIADGYAKLDRRHIVTFAGAQEAITAAFFTLIQPGDHVLVPMPAFPALFQIPRFLKANLQPIPLQRSDRCWSLDTDRLMDAIDEKTKLIVLNFPHNPTGAQLSQPQFEAVVDKARKVGAWIFSDEVFRGLESASTPRLPAMASVYERGLSLGVTSKSLGLGGLRVGWLACQSSELLDELGHVKHHLSICNSLCDEFLAAIALQNRERIQTELVAQIERNTRVAEQFFREHDDRFEWSAPLAGPVCFPKLLDEVDSLIYARSLLKKGVQIAPGSCFGDDTTHFRLGLGMDGFAAGIEHLLTS